MYVQNVTSGSHHSESGCVSSGQGENLLFVRSAGTEQYKQHQLLTVTAFKNFLSGQRREEKKHFTYILSIFLSVTAHLCQADGYYQNKNGPLGSE